MGVLFSEKGQGMIEYAIILGVIAVIVVTTVGDLGGVVNKRAGNVNTMLTEKDLLNPRADETGDSGLGGDKDLGTGDTGSGTGGDEPSIEEEPPIGEEPPAGDEPPMEDEDDLGESSANGMVLGLVPLDYKASRVSYIDRDGNTSYDADGGLTYEGSVRSGELTIPVTYKKTESYSDFYKLVEVPESEKDKLYCQVISESGNYVCKDKNNKRITLYSTSLISHTRVIDGIFEGIKFDGELKLNLSATLDTFRHGEDDGLPNSVVSYRGMFRGASGLTKLDLTDFNLNYKYGGITEEDLELMFEGYKGNWRDIDIVL